MSPDQSLQNAAVLMRHLADDEATEVFATLSPGLAVRLKAVMAKCEAEMPPKQAEIPVKYTPVSASHSQLVSDAGRYVRQILGQAFADEFVRGSDLSAPLPTPALGSGIERLKRLDAATIAQVCGAEHPQVIAVILVQLVRTLGAAALHQLPPRLQADVVLRIATLQPIQPVALQDLDQVLGASLDRNAPALSGPKGGVTTAADLIRHSAVSVKEALIVSMRQQDAAVAHKIEHNLNPLGTGP